MLNSNAKLFLISRAPNFKSFGVNPYKSPDFFIFRSIAHELRQVQFH